MNLTIPDFQHLQYGTLYCIGRNYSEHIEEMKSEKTADPVVFLKPRSSIIHSGDSIVIPPVSSDVHFEAELVILIGSKTKNISEENALSSIEAFGIGIDMTARDIQSIAKEKGLPWTLAKGFETFAPLGNFHKYSSDIDLQKLSLELRVNGDVHQSDTTSKMIFSISQLISYLSKHFTLYPGDLIFTGTPKGVGQIKPGDKIEATLSEKLSSLSVDVSK